MSVLPPDVHNELAQLLDALQSSDNSVRSQAEEHLANNWTTTKPELLLMGLVEQIQGSNDPTVHTLARYAGFVSCADSFRPPRRDPLLQLSSVE
jgi:hypothetical protein